MIQDSECELCCGCVLGRVLDWSIEGLKTTSGTSGSQLDGDWQDEHFSADVVSSCFCTL